MKLLFTLLLTIQLYAAQSGVYIELSGGLGLNDKIEAQNTTYVYDREYISSIALGYQADLLRFELEAIYKKDSLYSSGENNPETGDLEQTSQMLNLYYSGYNESKLVTTVGIGAGVTTVNLQSVEDKNILSYQGMFSIGYMSTQSLTITTEYTYFFIQKSDNFKSNADNIFSLNFRYLF